MMVTLAERTDVGVVDRSRSSDESYCPGESLGLDGAGGVCERCV